MKPISANSFVSANSPETNRRQAGDVSPVSLPYKGRDRDNRRTLKLFTQAQRLALALIQTATRIFR